MAGQALRSVQQRIGAGAAAGPAPLTPEERGLIALLRMRDEGNAFVGQWEITAAGEARRVPSRVIALGGPELLIGGLMALERDLVRDRPVDWRTYGLAAVDVAAIASGVAVLRFATVAKRGAAVAPLATRATPTAGARALARTLGVNALKFGVPVGLAALLVLHPSVVTHYLWVLAESFGLPGIIGPMIGWSLVVVPLALVLSWLLLPVRLLQLGGWLLGAAAQGCFHLARWLAAPAIPGRPDPALAAPAAGSCARGRDRV
jgi:hypothetical protein